MRLKYVLTFAIVLAALIVAVPTSADEGMHTFDNLPRKVLKEKYGFELTDEWARHFQLSSVRVSTGGSGSFVSPNGLVMTNHHVAQDAIQKVSDASGVDMVAGGFIALRPEAEIKCEDLEIIHLVSITDVTDRVRAALAGKSPEEAADARRAIYAELESEEKERPKYRREVQAFYGFDQYCVYRYRSYTDCRLVFAPEKSIASFGGDRDNFCYPRWCLDVAFFRIYEDGKPAETPHYFRWSRKGAQDGDLVFVSGHPGRTGRYETVSTCMANRDVIFPGVLERIRGVLNGLHEYSRRGPEEARRALDEISNFENSLKAYTGYLDGLKLDRVMKRIEQREQDFIAAAGERRDKVVAELDEIARINSVFRDMAERVLFRRIDSQLAGRALMLIDLAANLEKPEEERSPAYRSKALAATEAAAYSQAPIYMDMEAVRIRTSLASALKVLGSDDPFVRACLAGRTPDQIHDAVLASRLNDVEFRKELVASGAEGVKNSDDPVIRLVLAAQPFVGALAKERTTQYSEPLAAATTRLNELRREVLGRTGPPDANFTLRLSFGEVKGYELGTTDVPFTTTAWGLYDRNRSLRGAFPYDLPQSWEKARNKIDLDTEFNFVCTTDIIGGNSGSPVLNRNGEVVGLIFDGNIQMLSNNFAYDEQVARAVSVHSNIIIESLREVYDADVLADEIIGSRVMR